MVLLFVVYGYGANEADILSKNKSIETKRHGDSDTVVLSNALIKGSTRSLEVTSK